MTQIDWGTIGVKCQAEVARVRAELEAAGLGHVEHTAYHGYDGTILHVDVVADEPDHDKLERHFAGRQHTFKIHRKDQP